jgi:hypothetical protein
MYKDHGYTPLNPALAQSLRRRKWLLVVLAGATLLFFFATVTKINTDEYQSYIDKHESETSSKEDANSKQPSSNTSVTSPPPFRHRNVAVASDFGGHFDVYLAFVKTLHDVLSEDDDTYPDWTLQVFAGTPFGHGFQDVVDKLKLYEQKARHPDELDNAMKYDGTPADVGGGIAEEVVIDLLVFGTCEMECVFFSPNFLLCYQALTYVSACLVGLTLSWPSTTRAQPIRSSK